MNEALEKFLEDNQTAYQNSNGIYALLVYYFINKQNTDNSDRFRAELKQESMTKDKKKNPANSSRNHDLRQFLKFVLPTKQFKSVLCKFRNDQIYFFNFIVFCLI